MSRYLEYCVIIIYGYQEWLLTNFLKCAIMASSIKLKIVNGSDYICGIRYARKVVGSLNGAKQQERGVLCQV